MKFWSLLLEEYGVVLAASFADREAGSRTLDFLFSEPHGQELSARALRSVDMKNQILSLINFSNSLFSSQRNRS